MSKLRKLLPGTSAKLRIRSNRREVHQEREIESQGNEPRISLIQSTGNTTSKRVQTIQTDVPGSKT